MRVECTINGELFPGNYFPGDVSGGKVMAPYSPLLEQPVYLISEAWSRSVGWDSLEWYYPVGSGDHSRYDVFCGKGKNEQSGTNTP